MHTLFNSEKQVFVQIFEGIKFLTLNFCYIKIAGGKVVFSANCDLAGKRIFSTDSDG